MIKFPMKFEVEATATPGMGAQWTSRSDSLPPIPTAIPPEFMGPGGGYSPEDLFALAVLNCIIATFKVYAEKGKITYRTIQGKAFLTVDKQPSETGFGMTHIDIRFQIDGSLDHEKTKKTLENAIRDCAVGNSIKTGKTFNIEIS